MEENNSPQPAGSYILYIIVSNVDGMVLWNQMTVKYFKCLIWTDQIGFLKK